MRNTRILATGLACVTLSASLLQAQAARLPRRSFEDSWYWGAKGGVALFKSASENVTAPSGGIEWLITRSRAALNVSVEQSFFDTKGAVFDPTVSGSLRAVDISNLRRYQLSLMAFPKSYGRFMPYAGLGYALSVISDANPRGTFTSQTTMDSVFARVDAQSSKSSVVFSGGVQALVKRYALFLQGSIMPTRQRFLINGGSYTNFIEAGVRYNLTRAREPLN
jgi:hypothetical protein